MQEHKQTAQLDCKHPLKMSQRGLDCSSDLPSLRPIFRQGCCWRLGTDEDLAVSGEHLGREGEGGDGSGAGVNERQTPVVPTQLFSQSGSKASRTSRSTGNLRRVLPLFAVARRLAEGWKCFAVGNNIKTISNINFLDRQAFVSWPLQRTLKTLASNDSQLWMNPCCLL